MSANPSTKWFWNDWDNDRALALCSFAAQGLWMRLLSIAAREGGYLTVNGRPCSLEDLSVLVGHVASEIAPLLAELESKGVFSRNRDGTIYSRRIVRDEKNRKFFQKKGKEGGNPALLTSTGNKRKKSGPLNPSDIPPVDGGVPPPIPLSLLPTPEDSRVPEGTLDHRSHGDDQKTQKNQEDKTAKATKGRDKPDKRQLDREFIRFWASYPLRVGRKIARQKFEIARRSIDAETLVAAAERYAAIADPNFTAHPATWLHQGRWEDEAIQPAAVNGWHDPGPDEPPPIENWRVTMPTGGPH